MARYRKQIPIHEGMNKSIEDTYIYGGYKPELRDCIVDIVGDQYVVSKRPGLLELVDLGSSASVDGIEWWLAQARAVAISNGAGYTVNSKVGAKTNLTGSYFTAGNRVVLAEGPTNFYGADQGKINSISTSAVAEMADADAPTTVSHVAFLDQYLLANEVGSKKCHRSDVGDPTSWGSNWFSAEAKEDNLSAVVTENLEAFLFCKTSIEVWVDTGASDPFSRLDGGYIPSGVFAPYTIKFCGPPINSFVWLDHQRNLVVLNGRTPQSLSDSLNKYIQQKFYDLDDAAGDYFKVMGHSIYSLHLPTEGETLVFDFKSGLWYKWGYWNSGSSAYERWYGNCVTYSPDWGVYLVGDRANGKVYLLDEINYVDDGNAIKTLIRTPFIDRGDIGSKKICNYIEIPVKVTDLSGISTVNISLSYRDNDKAAWTTAKTLTFHPNASLPGQNVFTVRARRLGTYKARQWEISTLSSGNLTIYPPIEDYEMVYP